MLVQRWVFGVNLLTGEASELFYGGEVSDTERALLRAVSEVAPSQRAALLWLTQANAPQRLAIYYLLYKHHAGRREFDHAQRAAELGLLHAARQAGIPEDYRCVTPNPELDFTGDGPLRFWLFTLKALAFIRLRSGDAGGAADLLKRVARLAPNSGLGDEVVDAMLRAAIDSGSVERQT